MNKGKIGLALLVLLLVYGAFWGMGRLISRRVQKQFDKKELVYIEKVEQVNSDLEDARKQVVASKAETTAAQKAKEEAAERSHEEIQRLRDLSTKQQVQIFTLTHGEMEGDTAICLDPEQVRSINIQLAECDSLEIQLKGEKEFSNGLLTTVFAQQVEIDACYEAVDIRNDRIGELGKDLKKSEKKRKRQRFWGRVKNVAIGVGSSVATYFVIK